MNDEITVAEVRLLGEDGEQFGVVALADALEKAGSEELDLVEISPSAKPPVCRIMDFGKYKYQQQKKLHDQKKKNHQTDMKQIRIKTFRIDPHDSAIKLKKAREFIEGGHRLLFTLMFRAREHSHAELGVELLKEMFAKPLADVARLDSAPRKDGRRMVMMLSPLPNLPQILKQREREEAKAKAEAARLATVEQQDKAGEVTDEKEKEKAEGEE